MCGRRGQDHIASNSHMVFLEGNDLRLESVACMRLTRVIPLLREAVGRTQAHARGMINEIAVEMALIVPDGHDAPLCVVTNACRQHRSHINKGCGTTTLKPAGVVRRALADRHAGERPRVSLIGPFRYWQERLVGVTHRHDVTEDLVTDRSVDPHVGIHVEAIVVIEDEILLGEKMFVPSERRQRPWLMGDAMNP